jgi:hypothetical protein
MRCRLHDSFLLLGLEAVAKHGNGIRCPGLSFRSSIDAERLTQHTIIGCLNGETAGGISKAQYTLARVVKGT